MKYTALIIATLFVGFAFVATAGCDAQERRSRRGNARPTDSIPSGIAWYGVLNDGIADAKATNRPIMLLSAAPQCAGIPGMW
ncbi:MAG: hypothetical protein AB8B55_11620 [Mariniblastus sp.]